MVVNSPMARGCGIIIQGRILIAPCKCLKRHYPLFKLSRGHLAVCGRTRGNEFNQSAQARDPINSALAQWRSTICTDVDVDVLAESGRRSRE